MESRKSEVGNQSQAKANKVKKSLVAKAKALKNTGNLTSETHLDAG